MKVTYHSVAAFIFARKWRACGKAVPEDSMNITIHSGFKVSTKSTRLSAAVICQQSAKYFSAKIPRSRKFLGHCECLYAPGRYKTCVVTREGGNRAKLERADGCEEGMF